MIAHQDLTNPLVDNSSLGSAVEVLAVNSSGTLDVTTKPMTSVTSIPPQPASVMNEYVESKLNFSMENGGRGCNTMQKLDNFKSITAETNSVVEVIVNPIPTTNETIFKGIHDLPTAILNEQQPGIKRLFTFCLH